LSQTPAVSVLMPIHGDAPFLEQAIQSVESQTLKSWELLLIQDRPTASTIQKCIDAQSGNPRIRLVTSTSNGISSALNTGLRITRSPFVARIDSDDLMKPNRLLTQLAVMERKPDLVGLGSQAEYIDSNGLVTGKSYYPTTNWEIRALLPFVNPLIHPSVMIRSEALKSIAGYRTELDGVEDYNLWLRLSQLGKLENLDQFLIQYRRHPNQSSEKNRDVTSALQRIARLNALGVDTKPPSTSWAVHFTSKEAKEKKVQASLLERQASKSLQRALRAGRGMTDFLSKKALDRFFHLLFAIINAPIKSSAALFVLTRAKMKSYSWN
jgi:glycosyltransferase involved in cell wall biosynthesis